MIQAQPRHIMTSTPVRARRRIFAAEAEPVGELGPIEVAYLAGGRDQAAYAALASLYAARVVDIDAEGRIRRSGELPPSVTDIERVWYDLEGAQWRAEPARQPLHDAVDELRGQLIRDGWVRSDGFQRGLSVAARPLLAYAIGGLLPLVVVFGTWWAIPPVLLAGYLGYREWDRWSMNGDQHPAAGRLIARLRVGNAHLAPDHSPSWTVYGPAGAALSVALYGWPALMAGGLAFAEPAMEEEPSGSVGPRNCASCGGGCGGCGG